MIYIDSNVFIYPILEKTERAEKCKEILKKVVRQEVFAITSTTTWDEITKITKKYLGKEKAVIEGKKFLDFPNLKIISASKEILMKAQEAFEEKKLDPRDAIHYATAISNGAEIIATFDKDFKVIKGIKTIPN